MSFTATGPIDIDTLVLGPCMQSWGEPMAFIPARGQAQPGIRARFEEKARVVTFNDGNEVVLFKPLVGAQASQFRQQPVRDDVFQIRGQLWRVISVQPDGNGHLHIQLDLANDAQFAVAPTPPQFYSGL